ncbi:MAG: hypothetical protein SOR73_04260 [Romboutsia timonensis]|uniref:hypothetical protein n=1 Tax=Romboutsia timonensis TaxID=1776391 RepID=UPI002A74C321|nr:hypothetical protein [Romboutsia timonensis]MDY3000864.1 hypothetical protein [Romboutsia timonensis]
MNFKKRASKSIALALVGVAVTTPVLSNVNAMESNTGLENKNIQLLNDSEEYNLDENIKEINMSANDVSDLYEVFASQNKKAKIYSNGYDDIPDFVEYAVDNGFIEDNEVSKARMSKEGYRNIFRTAATTLKNFGLFYAGDFLANSLNDNPKTKSYAASSNLSADIKLQSGYQDSKNAIRNAIKKLSSSQTKYTRKNSFNLNKNGANKKSWDLFLALHGVSYEANATKSSSTKWNYTMTVTDYYDFKPENYKDSPIVNTVNNYAVNAMKAGAIVPFNIKVIINDSVNI